jgi:WD40-like Beta Propeller Repeat
MSRFVNAGAPHGHGGRVSSRDIPVWSAACVLIVAAGCVHPAAAFRCSSSEQCTGGGICQPSGFCSFDDPACASAQRYGAASGDLSGVCVGSEPDAPPPCDPAKPFGAAVLIEGLASTTEDASLRLSPDEKTAYFFSARSGSKLLYAASRARVTAPFSGVSVLANVNSGDQYNPAISADGLTLFFASFRAGGAGDNDIYQATRARPTDDFTDIRLAPNVNTGASEVQPYLTRDSTTLYFVRTVSAAQVVFRAMGSITAGFANPSMVAELHGPTNDTDPVVSADGLTVFWGSDRPGGMGDVDVWQAQRTTLSGVFGQPAPVTPVNTSGFDSPSDVSADGCRLYITSTRAGRTGIYVATRPP